MLEVWLVTNEMVGHIMPLLPYCEELLLRGHSITFFHPNDPKFRRLVASTGLAGCTSTEYESGADLFEFMKGQVDENCSRMPDVVVHDFFACDARDLADLIGVPSIAIFPNLAVTVNPFTGSSSAMLWTVWCALVIPLLEGILARVLWTKRNFDRFRRGLSLLAEQDIYPTKYQSANPRLFIGNTTVDFEHNSVASLPSEVFLMVGPSLPTRVEPVSDDLLQWINSQRSSGRKVVYVAFGSMYKYKEKTVRLIQQQLLECCRGKTSILWSLADTYQQHLLPLGDERRHWRIESHFPQAGLFRTGTVDAFVTHCGSNSVSEALLSGIPMVCCPGFADQNGNARRLALKGVGVIAARGTAGVGSALNEVLDNVEEMADNARGLKESMLKGGGAVMAANAIESAARHRDETPSKNEGSYWSGRRMPVAWLCVLIAAVFHTILRAKSRE